VERALDILLCFDREEPCLSLTRIADLVRLPKSTVHRHLATLEGKHFLTRDGETGEYHLGLRFVEMASLVLRDSSFEQLTQPHLERLSNKFGETVDLAVLDGDHVIYLQVIESPQRVKIAAAVGQRLPLHCTASGKAFLAFLPQDDLRRQQQTRLRRYTENTLLSVAALNADLQVTRARGYAISEHEYESDVNAVAAPILDGDGFPLAAVAVAGPSYRLSRPHMEEIGRSLQAVTDAIVSDGGLSVLSAVINRTVLPGLPG
jgi:IclR family acetate operon transcriptional repressor